MEKNIAGKTVRVYKDAYGFYPTPANQRINCDSVEDHGRVKLFSSASQEIGGPINQPGAEYQDNQSFANLADVPLIDTVKIRTSDGFRWLHPTDYDALITECNSCCNS